MNNIKNLNYLLRDINVLRKKYEERKKNEDNFNLFTILKKDSDEVYLHSRFLSSILDPAGPHGLGTIVLNSFLYRIESNFVYDEKSIEVYPNNHNRSEYKKIDISFIDRITKKAVIIENKIYHEDSNHEDKGQLENYYERLIEEDKIPEDGIEVYYLTLDGHEPSEDSVSLSNKFPKLKEKVKCISYSIEILDWLRVVVKECYNKPSLRESIIQYIKLIENMTNNETCMEEIKEILEVIGCSEDNLMSAKLLIDNRKHIQWDTVSDFWSELTEQFVANGFKIQTSIQNEDIDLLIHGGPRQKKVDMVLIVIKGKFPVWIEADYDDWLYWGLYHDKNEEVKIPRNIISKIQTLKLEGFEYEKEWLCWKYFGINDSERICLSDFDQEGTFRLISPQYRKEVIKRIVIEIEDFMDKMMK